MRWARRGGDESLGRAREGPVNSAQASCEEPVALIQGDHVGGSARRGLESGGRFRRPPIVSLQRSFTVRTRGRGMTDITAQVAQVVAESGVRAGLCLVFCRHTSASLLITENASPDAHRDLLAWLARLAPDGDPAHEHVLEGPDDMPAHLRCVLTRSSETVPVADGRLALGRWQGIFLLEHRLAGSERQLVVHVGSEAVS
jgi:secondary thiamine-phosphate synthase enzyme